MACAEAAAACGCARVKGEGRREGEGKWGVDGAESEVWALWVGSVNGDKGTADKVLSQLKAVIRPMYSR